MKFPRIPVALLLLAGLTWPVEAPPPAASPAGPATPKVAKVAKPAKAKKPTRAEAAKAAALKATMDSLARLDSLRRVDSLHTFDSLFRIQDSLRMDSTRRADSLRRIDSLERVAKTWYVTRVRDFTGSPAVVAELRSDLAVQFQRNGGIWLAEPASPDTCTSFECSWREGLASGAGKILYTALYRTADSGWKLSGWLFESGTGNKLDSASLTAGRSAAPNTLPLARELARHLHPSPTQALCTADSLAQAATLWAFEIPVNRTTDTAMNARLRGRFAEAFAATGRARTLLLKDSVFCPTRGCLDTLAAAKGAHRALQFDIAQHPDSSWRLILVVSRTSPDSLIDSILVTAPRFDGLVDKAVPLLLPPPSACRSGCGSSDPAAGKLVWSVGTIQTDSARAAAIPPLAEALAKAFSSDGRHQFVRVDSGAKSLGGWVDRRIDVRLSGSDSLWNFQARIVDPRTGSTTDSLDLSRGGWRPRVFAWFARKLLEAVHPTTAGCGRPCTEDSARTANARWVFVPTTSPSADTSLTRYFDDLLLDKMAGKGRGRVVNLPDSLACRTWACIDSAAASLGAAHIVRTFLKTTPDSIWSVQAKVTTPGLALVVDSNIQFQSGPAHEAFPQIADRLLGAVAPVAPRCDSCVSRDTLEAGLALIEPRWKDVSDTLQNLFVDSLRGALARDGHFQVLPLSLTAPIYSSSGGTCDSACRQELFCRTGATSLVTSSLTRDGSGWKVSAQLVDVRTGKTVASMSSLEHRNDAQRLREIAPWVARKLCGVDTANEAPSSRRRLDPPWGKIIALLLPIGAGLASVISRW